MPLRARLWRRLPDRAQWRLLWLLNAKFVLGVTGIVFDGGGRVLLLKHTFRRRYPWGLVSGYVNRGESPEAALYREIAEETALSVAVGELFRVNADRLSLAVELVYVCRYVGGSFRPNDEVTEIRWRHPDAGDLPAGFHPHHRRLVQEAARLLRERTPA